MIKKIPVGILGATGVVGSQTIQLLEDHPWFEVVYVAASTHSSGKTYHEAMRGRWHLNTPIPRKISLLKVHEISEITEAKKKCHILFSALASDAALKYEEYYANEGFAVISNASAHRKNAFVPMIIPEVNHEHLSILPSGGFIVVKPNCSIQSVVLPLHPLHQSFGVKKIHMTTLQAVSGAGLPGVSSLHITDNIIPHIEGEEEKSEWEPLKIWGKIHEKKIQINPSIEISATCNRVPVLDGHLACVSVSFHEKPTYNQIIDAWDQFEGLNLPSSPKKPVHYLPEQDRPQPRLDRYLEKGMGIAVGRLRPCPLLDFRFTSLSHNTIRGASGGSILIAELLHQQKRI